MLAEECSRESPGSRHLENTESAPLTNDVYLFLGVLPRENICAPPPGSSPDNLAIRDLYLVWFRSCVHHVDTKWVRGITVTPQTTLLKFYVTLPT